MIDRLHAEIRGFSGAMYVHSLRGNAERGDTAAAFRLGLLHQEGQGTDINFKTAAFYFQKAADKEDSKAMNTLGLYYRFGIGVKKDEKKAEELLKKAVLKKNINACYNLGRFYADRDDFLQAWLLADLSIKKNGSEKRKEKIRTDQTAFNRIGKTTVSVAKGLSGKIQTVLAETGNGSARNGFVRHTAGNAVAAETND